jgi:hypothetical protein
MPPTITRQVKEMSMKSIVAQLTRYMVGWRGYFGSCETPEELIYLNNKTLSCDFLKGIVLRADTLSPIPDARFPHALWPLS